jgi:hypothetical protein
MKTIVQIVLWVVCVVLGYLIYKSVYSKIDFEKTRNERFQVVVDKLKDIRDSQDAYSTVNGKYAANFKDLIAFIDTGQYTITQQRDSSFIYFDKVYRIEMSKDTILIDTLGFVKVKDSIFKGSDRYKDLASVPFAPNNEKFKIEVGEVQSGGFTADVFKVSAKKDWILHDQPEDLRALENAHNSIEEVNGDEISVGDLNKVSTSGNWPSIYDQKD